MQLYMYSDMQLYIRVQYSFHIYILSNIMNIIWLYNYKQDNFIT